MVKNLCKFNPNNFIVIAHKQCFWILLKCKFIQELISEPEMNRQKSNELQISKKINIKPDQQAPETSHKNYYNIFNQSANLAYQFNDHHADQLGSKIVQNSKYATIFQYLSMGEKPPITQLHQTIIKQNKNTKLIGILKTNNSYTLYSIFYEDQIVCEVYHQTDQQLSSFQSSLKVCGMKIKGVHKQKYKQEYFNENVRYCLFDILVCLSQIVNGQKKKTRVKNIAKIRQWRMQFGMIYLKSINQQFCLRNWSDWHKLPQNRKKQYLNRVNPLTPKQFMQAAKVEEDRIQSQLAELMKFAIETFDSQFAKVILRIGVPLTGGAYINQFQTKISFIALIQKKLQACTTSQKQKQNQLQAISKSLKKYGYTDMITNIMTTKKNLKKQQNYDILVKISKINRVDIKLFESFMNLLKSHLHAKITGILAAVSGEVHMTAGSTVDSLMSKALGKAPYIGSILSSAYDSFVFACQKARKQNLSRFFSSSSQIEQIIQDYSIRIIRHYSEQIINPIPKSILKQIQSLLNQKIKQLSIKFPIKYIFKVHGLERNYTVDWQILCTRYVGQFLQYLVTQQAVQNFVKNNSFGINAARKLFEYHKINKQDLASIVLSDKYDQANCYIFSKLVSYISQIHRYPKSIAFTQDFYWFNSKLQANKINFNVRSIVMAEMNKIVIGFYMDQDERVSLSGKSSEIYGIRIAENLVKSYDNFVDNSFFIKANNQVDGDGDDSTVCFGKLMNDLNKKYKNAMVFVVGFGFGGVVAALTRLLLVHDYNVKSERIVGYSYGEDMWCYKDCMEKVLDLFKNHYQIHLNQLKIQTNKDFCYFGNRIFLKSQKINPQSNLYTYINILQSKQFIKKQQKQFNSSQKPFAQQFQQLEQEQNKPIQNKVQPKFTLKQIALQKLLKIISKGDFSGFKRMIDIEPENIKNMKQSQHPLFKQNKSKMLEDFSKYEIERIFGEEPFESRKQKNEVNLTQRKNALKILKHILQSKLLKNPNLLKILCRVVQFGDMTLVKYLVEDHNVELNQSCHSFNWFIDSGTLLTTTPLISSIIGIARCLNQNRQIPPQLQITKYLIQTGKADVNYSINHDDKQQKTKEVLIRKATIGTISPIVIALDVGHLQLIKYLVSKGCNLFSATHRQLFNNWNALSLSLSSTSQIFYLANSIRKEKLNVIKYLIDEKGFKVNNLKLPDTDRSINIDADVALFLIERGLSPNSTIQILGHLIDTLLMLFVRRNNYIMVEYLLEKGADPNINTTGYQVGTALHCASCNFNSDNFTTQLNLSMFKLLLKYGGDLSIKISGLVARFKQSETHRLNKTPLDFLLSLESTQPHVRKYLDILRLQNKIPNQTLTFQSFQQTTQKLLEAGFDYYTISCYFVSQFIEIENKIKVSNSMDKSMKELKKKIYKIKPQFYQGTHKLQQFNKAVEFLFSYYNPKRFDQALNICEKNGQDLDFVFLKATVYLQLANGYDKQKFQFYKEKICQILPILEGEYQRLYILGDLAYLQNNKQQAITYYLQSYKINKNFDYPKLKLLTLILQYGLKSKILVKIIKPSPEQIFTEIFNEVSKHTLPLDLSAMMRDIHQRKQNINAFKKDITSEDQNFAAALRQTFNVDVKVLKYNIEKLVPEKLYNVSLTYMQQNKNQKLNIKKLLKQIDYAFAILNEGYTFFNRMAHSHVPDRPDSHFFKKLNQLIVKLQVLKDGVENKCYSKRDFKREGDQQFCIMLIQSLIDYYEDYIDRVVRSYSQDQDTNYVKYFFQIMGRRLDVEDRVQVFTQNKLRFSRNQKKGQLMRGPFLLKQVASEHLTIQVPSGDQLYGTHKVIVLPTTGSNQIFYKFQPYAPGIQYAVGSLYKLILPNSTPDTMLLKLTDGKKSGLYLASKAITGSNFAETINQIQYVNLIDMKNFSGLFISSLLVCTGDAKPDNFVMHFNYNKNELVSTELISIDNDIAFYRSKLRANPDSKNLYSDMLNILYLMPQMDQPVSPYLREYLNKPENQPEIIVAKWLGSLYLKNQHYLSMKGFTQQDLRKLKLPIKLPSGTACTIYSILNKLTQLLKTPTITHTEIFRTLSPSLSYFYTKCRDNTSMVNSLKNLYVAAGANPAILASLYSLDKIKSSNAWNTMSASKRRDINQFNKLFNSEIVNEAENFIGMIDFTGKDVNVINAIKANLHFVRNVVLHNIEDESYKLLMKQPTFTKLQYQKTIQSNHKNPNHLKTILSPPQKLQTYPQITSIRQLLTHYPQLPTNYQLITLLTQNNLPINQLNSKGQTLLFEIVYRIMNKTMDEKYGIKLIKILLDCGMDTKIRNYDGQGILDIAISVPYMVLTIFEHKPIFFYELVKNGMYQQARTIAKSIHSDACVELLDSQLVGNENSILRQILSNKEMKNIAMLILTKQQNEGLWMDQKLVGIFVQNYQDCDVDLLQILLTNGLKPTTKNTLGLYPADIAIKLKKYHIATMLLNSGGFLTPTQQNTNLKLISKATQYNIKLDINDLITKYNLSKTNIDGDTLLHAMARNGDHDILCFGEFVIWYRDQISQFDGKSLGEIAVGRDFVELMEIVYGGGGNENQGLYEAGGHKLSKNQLIKSLSKLLKTLGFSISLNQARNGINFSTKIDQKGNTALQKLIKLYLTQKQQDLCQKITTVLENAHSNYINQTCRPDGNTILHLLIRSRQTKYAYKLWCQYHENIDLAVSNAQGLTVIQYCIQIMGENVFGRQALLAHNKTVQKLKQIEQAQIQNLQQKLSADDKRLQSIRNIIRLTKYNKI